MAAGKSSLTKEARTALKAAKEAIKNKEFKEALKQCKVVLREDKAHYNGLVFVGVAAAELGQPDQGVAAYKKAIEGDPGQELAWQGLCSLYEKTQTAEHKAALEEAYPQLMKILEGKDAAKWIKFAKKLLQLLLKNGRKEKTLAELDRIIQSGHCDVQTVLELQMQYVNIAIGEEKLRGAFQEKVEATFKSILTSDLAKRDEKRSYFKEYITFILNRDTEMVKEECARMHEDHPSDPYPIAVMVELNLQQGTDGPSDDTFIALEKLRALDPTHHLIDLAEGQTKLSRKNYQEAKEALTRGIENVSSNPLGWLYKAHCHVKLHENKLVEVSVLQGLRALRAYSFPGVNKGNLEQQFLLLQSTALIDSGGATNSAKALEITERLLKNKQASSDLKIAHVGALLQNGQLDRAKAFISEIAAGSLTPREHLELKVRGGQVAFTEGRLSAALECFQQVSSSDAVSALTVYWQGRVYWEMGGDARSDKTKCFDCLKKAASMDPHHSETFLYLGYFFLKVAGDSNKSMQCFKKSYHLNPDSEEAGSMLGDSLIASGQQDIAFELYNSVTCKAAAGTAKWAWLRLGLYHFKFGDPTDAINCFQSALRADPTDKQCWECLGDAYMKRGSYTAAMKTFTRGIELGGSTTYCQYQIASIKKLLGLYSEALTDYEEVLAEAEDYVPALKGQGETSVWLARISLAEFFNGRAVDYISRAINTVARASVLRPDLCSIWSLLGTACSLLHPLDSELIRVNVPASLLPSMKSSLAGGDSRVLGKSELLALGAKCYTRALQLQPESGRLWCDLGVNYFHQSQNSKDNEAMLVAKAFQCIYKAISLDSSNYQYWNTLGVVCCSNGIKRPSLAQHCFIKSIQLEKNNVVAWTNLGVLYLTNSDIKLAHQAFKVSQSLEPSYVQCWIGQAIIAESVGSDEAMDLFRHTTELKTHNEGSIGYAHWVCQTLLDSSLDQTSQLYLYNILQMNAVQQAYIAMEKHNDRSHSEPSVLMLQGLLLERQGLNLSARKAYKRCVALLEVTEDKEKLDAARVNYARCLSSCENSEEAVKQYEATSSMTDSASLFGYALCLYKAGNYQKCSQVYESILESCHQSSEDEAHILAALGMVAYRCGDVPQAKTMLFKSSQKSPQSEPGLKALCALGIGLKDPTLTQAVITELGKMSCLESGVYHLALLTCALFVMQGQPKKALKSMAAHIHRYPWLSNIRQATAEVIISELPQLAEVAAILMQSVLQLQKSLSVTTARMQSLSDLAAGRFTGTTNRKQSCISSAQRAVFLFPDDLRNWSLLTGALVGDALLHGPVGPGKKEQLDRCLSFVNQQAKAVKNDPLEQWSVVLSLWWNLYQCQYDQCIGLAKTYSEWCNYPEDIVREIELISRLAEVLKLNRRYWEVENLQGLKMVVAESLSNATLQFLGTLYLRGGLTQAATHCYRQARMGPEANHADLLKLFKLALDVTLVSDKPEEWLKKANEAFSEASRKRVNRSSVCVSLLQGILKQLEDNQRQSKKGFLSVLNDPTSPKTAVSIARFHLIKLLRTEDTTAALDILERARESGDTNLPLLENLLE